MHRINSEGLGCSLQEWGYYLPRVGEAGGGADMLLIIQGGTRCHPAGQDVINKILGSVCGAHS